MKILTILGARPQFIKAFAVSREIRKKHDEILLHTGQHYDEKLSDIFFEELNISKPDYNLGVGSGTHGYQTAEMMKGIEEIADEEDPDLILLYGDTNSTLAGAIVGSKLNSLVAHVEAGLRSYNWDMPEEVNRVLTDHASDLLFAPSKTAANNLEDEGITKGVHIVGDVMYDAILWAKKIAFRESKILDRINLVENKYILSTVHRAGNTDNKERLEKIMIGLSKTSLPVILPIHPKTRKKLSKYDLWNVFKDRIRIIDPVGYLDFIRLLDEAKIVATDSGGIQKEAFFLDTPCVTLRNETEWIETVKSGWNKLVGAKPEKIIEALKKEWDLPSNKPSPYGSGDAAKKIVEVLESDERL